MNDEASTPRLEAGQQPPSDCLPHAAASSPRQPTVYPVGTRFCPILPSATIQASPHALLPKSLHGRSARTFKDLADFWAGENGPLTEQQLTDTVACFAQNVPPRGTMIVPPGTNLMVLADSLPASTRLYNLLYRRASAQNHEGLTVGGFQNMTGAGTKTLHELMCLCEQSVSYTHLTLPTSDLV